MSRPFLGALAVPRTGTKGVPATGAQPAFAKLIERIQKRLKTLGHDQVPMVDGPSGEFKNPIPWARVAKKRRG
jgi:hypothetical protein